MPTTSDSARGGADEGVTFVVAWLLWDGDDVVCAEFAR